MKTILTIIFLTLITVVNAQDSIVLKSHKSDHFLAGYTDEVLVMVDTTYMHNHFEVQFLFKDKRGATLKVYINGRLYRKLQCVIRKGVSYSFYYPGLIKTARIEYLEKIIYITY